MALLRFIGTKNSKKQVKKRFRELVYGLLDLSIALILFLPLFAVKTEGVIQSVSLINLCSVQSYVKNAYYIVTIAMIIMGVLTLALQNCNVLLWIKVKTPTSIMLGIISVILFVISLQPYAAVFAFVLLIIKASLLIIS